MLRIAKAIHTIEGLKVLLIKIAFGNLYIIIDPVNTGSLRTPVRSSRNPLGFYLLIDRLTSVLKESVYTDSIELL